MIHADSDAALRYAIEDNKFEAVKLITEWTPRKKGQEHPRQKMICASWGTDSYTILKNARKVNNEDMLLYLFAQIENIQEFDKAFIFIICSSSPDIHPDLRKYSSYNVENFRKLVREKYGQSADINNVNPKNYLKDILGKDNRKQFIYDDAIKIINIFQKKANALSNQKNVEFGGIGSSKSEDIKANAVRQLEVTSQEADLSKEAFANALILVKKFMDSVRDQDLPIDYYFYDEGDYCKIDARYPRSEYQDKRPAPVSVVPFNTIKALSEKWIKGIFEGWKEVFSEDKKIILKKSQENSNLKLDEIYDGIMMVDGIYNELNNQDKIESKSNIAFEGSRFRMTSLTINKDYLENIKSVIIGNSKALG